MFEGLRILVGIVGAFILLAGVVGVAAGGASWPGGLWAIAIGSVGIIVAVLEQRRYATDEDPARRDGPPPRLEPTAEVFVDPTTGEQTRVYVDRASGRRHYQRES
jgi:hypothetical protein